MNKCKFCLQMEMKVISQATSSFIAKITIFVFFDWLPTYFIYILQLLKVEIFGPLKIIVVELAHLVQQEVSHLRNLKVEWIITCVQVCKRIFTLQNIFSSWNGVGLILFNSQKVLYHIFIKSLYPLWLLQYHQIYLIHSLLVVLYLIWSSYGLQTLP